MLHSWEREEPMLAAGARCPMPGRGSVAVAFMLAEKRDNAGRERFRDWLFVCQRCEFGFRTNRENVLFQSVPESWLLGGVSRS
jgi:hypothetical protein